MCISHIVVQASGVDDLSEKYTKMKLLKELLNQVFELQKNRDSLILV